MTTLFSQAKNDEVEPAKASLGSQVRQSVLFGGGLFGGGGVAYGVFEILKSEPEKGFRLLEAWGPWVFFAGLCVWAGYTLSLTLIRSRERSDDRMAVILDRFATGQERLATAAEAAASKDDRQIQQMEILVSTVVMQTKRVLRKLHAQDRALERLEDKAGINRPTEEPGQQELDDQ